MEIDAGILIQALGSLFRRQDPLEALERQVREQRLRLELGTVAAFATPMSSSDLCRERRDICIVGERGAGKTATAFALGLGANRSPVYAIDWTGPLPKGIVGAPLSSAVRQSGAVLIFDEAALRVGVGQRTNTVWATMALARQRDQVIIWTSQSGAAIDVHVLRQGVTRLWLRGESAFEREELQPEAITARMILRGQPEQLIGQWCGMVDNQWRTGRAELPEGWSKQVSNAWA